MDKLKEQNHTNPVNNQEGVDDKGSEYSFGKFKTKEELMSAYSSLEAEFTRRSQRIKELESVVNKQETDDKWAKKVEELTTKYPVAKELSGEIGAYLESQKDILNEENCLEKALLHVLARGYQVPNKGKEVMDASVKTQQEIILEYVNSLKTDLPEVASMEGEIPVILPHRPKTISEAGELAIQFIKNTKK